MHNMRPLNVFDEFFMYDDDRNLAHPVMALSFTKFDFKPMSDYLLQEFTKIIPFRCRITNYLGSQFFKTMKEEEYARIWPQICVDVKDVHTKDELQKFICTECM